MFESVKFYIIVSDKSFIIKKEKENLENKIDFTSFVPNVPFYHHLFDEDKNYMDNMKAVVKNLKIRNLTMIVPDDCIDLTVDKRILTEFFTLCGVRKIQIEAQCFFLNLENKRYVSLSKTARNMVLQYIVNGKSIAKKYYDKNYEDIKQISLDMKSIHTDCQYEYAPVYINNMNNNMDRFSDIGTLVSLNDITKNIMNC
ncbi:hypothetical protein HBE96_14970 [Clostridium sp. P21]|uniref:Uncharacterized protein n=1 Tax=Clostridium muellerianum TaxID=2716538 RepID=A0A7Y0EI87_9CLOT|nr:hypothetical protein [Clostridium muellerianum]NMM63953.1 hypothetical protein [Clostridium muellerianum]